MLSDNLALINDILQATIIIFGASVVLYNLKYVRRDRVIRAFTLLLGAVIAVYFTELLVSRTQLADSAVGWLRVQWLGISFVPAVQFHLSDALLVTTGSTSRRRRALTFIAYAAGAAVYSLVLLTPQIAGAPLILPNATHLVAGPLFGLFAAFYWLTSSASIYNVWRAYRRCITRSTRRRMLFILLAIMAAPLGVFPYLAMFGPDMRVVSPWMWLLLILGNLMVAFMFSQLTANIVYLGSVSSDRVVRVRLYKFMARVPMTASIVLLVYVLTNRSPSFLGLDTRTAAAITVVGTVMLVEWAIHAYKQHLERALQFNNEPDVRRIQELSERLLTTQDMQQFLESLLAAGCDALRTPSAFVAALTPHGPELSALVGSAEEAFAQTWQDEVEGLLPDTDQTPSDTGPAARWQRYWIFPLYSRQDDLLLGILGLERPEEALHFSAAEQLLLTRLRRQSAAVLEDRILQEGIFAAVQGLLPGITAFQRMRSAAKFGGALLLEDERPAVSPSDGSERPATSDPEFTNVVRDALNHYWGGPKLTESPLLELEIVRSTADQYEGNPIKALRAVLRRAIELQRPPGEQSMMRSEWLLYNILELKFVQGQKVRDVARRLAMSESDLYRKQRVAIENVARTIAELEAERLHEPDRRV